MTHDDDEDEEMLDWLEDQLDELIGRDDDGPPELEDEQKWERR